jgi:hypothetical protein
MRTAGREKDCRWFKLFVGTVLINLSPWILAPAVMSPGLGFEWPVLLVALIPIVWTMVMFLVYRTAHERVVFYVSAIAGMVPAAGYATSLLVL